MTVSCFDVGYLLLIISSILKVTTVNNAILNRFLTGAGISFLIINLLLKREKKRYMIIELLLISALFFSYIISGSDLLLIVFLAGASTKKINLRNLVKKDLMIRIPLIFSICLLSVVGIIPNIAFYMKGLYKNSLGFSHPNHLGIMLLIITIYWFFLKHLKFRVFDYLFIYFLFFISIYISGSRTSAYIILFILCFEFITSKLGKIEILKKIRNKILKVLEYLIYIIPLASVWLAYNFNPQIDWMRKLDEAMTGRLSLTYYAAKNNPILWFGQFIQYKGGIDSNVLMEYRNAIDNSYVFVLLRLGIIAFAILVFSIFILLKYFRRSGNINAFYGLCFITVAAISESTMFEISHNIFLLCLIPALKYLKTVNKKFNNLKI